MCLLSNITSPCSLAPYLLRTCNFVFCNSQSIGQRFPMFSFFFPYIVSLPPNECETYHKNIRCLICLSGALRCRPKEVSMPRFYLRKDYVKENGERAREGWENQSDSDAVWSLVKKRREGWVEVVQCNKHSTKSSGSPWAQVCPCLSRMAYLVFLTHSCW